jgi:undecaprenyl-diphosphatase
VSLLERVRAADLELFKRTTQARVPLLDRTMPALSRAADHSVLWAGVAGVLALTGGRRGRRAALRGLAAIAVTSPAANLFGKLLVARRRPALHLVPAAGRAKRIPTSHSFPSGHSASAAAFTTGVACELPGAAVPVGALAAAVGFSRVYVGVHYPGDVLGGFALGTALGLATRLKR